MMHWQDAVINFFIQYGFQICGALIILGIGLFVASWAGRLTMRWLSTKELEPPVRILLVRVVKLIILTLVLVLVLDKFGVQIAPLIAGIGVAGVGIGLALQGVLGNLMAGLTIIFTKPFRVGEYIELLGNYGQVQSIELFSTVLLHSDKSRVVIPNRKIVGEILHNYGTIRQLDLKVGVAYSADLTKVVASIRQILQQNPRVLKDPVPVVGISELADSSITVKVQPWVQVPDYGDVQLEIYQAMVEQFRASAIEIPFPQREVRFLNPPAVTAAGA
jgi:small conductance mechanosensitive channel